MGNQCQSQSNNIHKQQKVQIQYDQNYLQSQWPSNDNFIQKWLKSLDSSLIKAKKPLKHKFQDLYIVIILPTQRDIYKGIIYRPHKFFYQGQIKKSIPHNKGKITFINTNCKYKGQIKNGQAQRNGEYIDHNKQYLFQGKWANGQPKSGQLIFTKDKVIQQIQIQDNNQLDRNLIKGKIYYRDKKIYQGTFDKYTLIPQGKGKIIFSDNVIYEGNLSSGQMEGEGIFTWQLGKYEGNFQKNKKEGFGRYIYQSGKFYEGFWKNGKQQGLGVVYTQVGIPVLRGKWSEGQFKQQIQEEQFQMIEEETRIKFSSEKLKKQKKQREQSIQTNQQSKVFNRINFF